MLKQPNICLPGNNSTLQSTSTHETGFFSWATAQKVYNLLPLGIASCESIYEAKMYTVALLVMLSPVFFPLVIVAWFVYNSAKKGGQND